jgi:hypothetical protein
MSQLIRTDPKSKVFSTFQRSAIMNAPFKSVFQVDKGTTASPSAVSPGSTTSINIKINGRNIEQEENQYIVYEVENKSAVQTVTFKRGPLTHWDKITITVSNSRDKIEIDGLNDVIELFSESLLNEGQMIYENSQFWRNELDTCDGITVTNGTPVTFYLPLAPIINFAKTTLRGAIEDIKIDFRATPAPSNAKDAGLIALSSAATAAYTQANISFNNIRFIRHYSVINDPRLVVGVLASDVPMRHVHYRTETKVMRSGTWNLGDSVNFKLSDVLKRSGIQHLSVVVRKNNTTYNDADIQKEYSGSKYVTFKYRQLFGEKLEVDMSSTTDKRLLEKFEKEQYGQAFGRKQLPIAMWKDTDLMTKFYLRMTRINFDYVQVENAHELVRETNSVDEDYDITLYAGSNVGADCDVLVHLVYAEVFEFSKNGQMTKLY